MPNCLCRHSIALMQVAYYCPDFPLGGHSILSMCNVEGSAPAEADTGSKSRRPSWGTSSNPIGAPTRIHGQLQSRGEGKTFFQVDFCQNLWSEGLWTRGAAVPLMPLHNWWPRRGKARLERQQGGVRVSMSGVIDERWGSYLILMFYLTSSF